ncbi:hypothetical protein NE237_002672 [Protea cynaroides]|uniref:Uncharacterized protein n=1 Tax=Protea cynaroides TaxID=273540 RepID=A0A9Q0GM08_9MAGN|nr:hypothetical protein NE237_002672 [Protea cynaroides]
MGALRDVFCFPYQASHKPQAAARRRYRCPVPQYLSASAVEKLILRILHSPETMGIWDLRTLTDGTQLTGLRGRCGSEKRIMTYDAVAAAVARGTRKRLFLSLGTAHFRRQAEVALERATSLGRPSYAILTSSVLVAASSASTPSSPISLTIKQEGFLSS